MHDNNRSVPPMFLCFHQEHHGGDGRVEIMTCRNRMLPELDIKDTSRSFSGRYPHAAPVLLINYNMCESTITMASWKLQSVLHSYSTAPISGVQTAFSLIAQKWICMLSTRFRVPLIHFQCITTYFYPKLVHCCHHHANPSLTGILMPISMLKDLHYSIRSLAVWLQSSTWLITAWNLFRTLIFYSSQSLCGPTNFIYIACPSQQYGEMN